MFFLLYLLLLNHLLPMLFLPSTFLESKLLLWSLLMLASMWLLVVLPATCFLKFFRLCCCWHSRMFQLSLVLLSTLQLLMFLLLLMSLKNITLGPI